MNFILRWSIQRSCHQSPLALKEQFSDEEHFEIRRSLLSKQDRLNKKRGSAAKGRAPAGTWNAHHFIRFLVRILPAPTDTSPSSNNNGSGEAVAGNSTGGGGAAAATCSGPIEPVTWTDAVVVSDPPQTFVAVILYVTVSSMGPGALFCGDAVTVWLPP